MSAGATPTYSPFFHWPTNHTLRNTPPSSLVSPKNRLERAVLDRVGDLGPIDLAHLLDRLRQPLQRGVGIGARSAIGLLALIYRLVAGDAVLHARTVRIPRPEAEDAVHLAAAPAPSIMPVCRSWDVAFPVVGIVSAHRPRGKKTDGDRQVSQGTCTGQRGSLCWRQQLPQCNPEPSARLPELRQVRRWLAYGQERREPALVKEERRPIVGLH